MSDQNNCNSRAELVQKLDEDLEKHIEEVMQKNKDYRYKDGLNPEKLDEELRLIPAFSNSTPTQEDIDASPALQALQALKYETDNPDACALAHKEDGNYHFQKSEYKKAIIAYTEGIKQKHDDKILSAVLYTNRAAAQYYLGNKGSAMKDAMWALKFESNHMKAVLRCAMCSMDLEKYIECLEWCNRGLLIDDKNEKLKVVRKKCTLKKKEQDRDQRKHEIKNTIAKQRQKAIADAIQARGIQLDVETTLSKSLDSLLNVSNAPESGKLYLDENSRLHWPCFFVYPEHSTSDFVEDFIEDSRFIDQLLVMFERVPDWDNERAYSMDTIEIFFEDTDRERLIRVPHSTTLATVLSDRRYKLSKTCPVFLILSSRTRFYAETFSEQSHEEL